MKLFSFLKRKTNNLHHITYSNNDEYHGEMKDNLKHGKGVYKFDNGNRYEGEWQNNQKHGTGKYYYNSGELYIGQWKQNKKSGHGQHFGQYGDRYVGQWLNNYKNGKGTIFYGDNSIYSGQFYQNKKNGPGYYYSSITKELRFQIFENDNLLEQNPVEKIPSEFENVFSAYLVHDNHIKHLQSLQNKSDENNLNQQEVHGFETLQALNETVIVKGNKKMQEWNKDQVCSWLECLGLSQYKENFMKNHILGETLHNLTDRELKEELGMQILGHRKQILQQINMHKKYYIKTMSNQVQKTECDNSADQSSKYDQLFSIIQKIEPTIEKSETKISKQKKLKQKITQETEEKQFSPQSQKKQSPKQGNQGQSLKTENNCQVSNFNIDNMNKSVSLEENSFISIENQQTQLIKENDYQKCLEKGYYNVQEINLQQKHQEKIMCLLKDLGINEKLLINFQEIKQGSKIGEGNNGIVFKGNWLGQDVAIKSYCQKQDQSQNKQTMADFLKEVQVISDLRHPNIVLYMGVCIKRHNFYLITEYMENGSLYDYIHKRKTKNLNFVHIIEDIALGMNNLHGRGIMHCDLKSSNVLIDSDWNVKLCDFGLSRIKTKKTKSIIETSYQMAPEIMRGEPYTEKSDIFSFGMILWEIMTSKIPYENLSITQMIETVGWGNNLVEIPQKSNPPILAILAKDCLQKEPSKRPNFARIVERIQQSKNKKCHNKDKAKKLLIDFLQN
ncbi:unnamed protein product [Paramecium primaurelia]|uniref:non-specific serine/threonine protein kinase n=1 Tax=Paramecium primaurelia TaxID=5886 RepID=A0A8S1K8H3_PARPR|nr:unnamed protein product [Paramecium primaurelia]